MNLAIISKSFDSVDSDIPSSIGNFTGFVITNYNWINVTDKVALLFEEVGLN